MQISDESFIGWILGGITGFIILIGKWMNGKVDKKVSKDVFNEFKEKNDLAHGMTHSTLKEIKDGQTQIWNKLDDKKDKD